MNSLSKSLLLISCLVPIFIWADSNNKKSDTALQAFYQKAFGVKRKLPSQLEVTLHLGSRDVATLKIYSDNRKKITHIEKKPLIVVLKTVLKPKYLTPLLAKLTDKRVALTTLKDVEIATKFDQANLSLNLFIPIKMRLPIPLTLGRKHIDKHPKESELAKAAMVSGYTNLDALFDYDALTKEGEQRLKMDSVLNINGVVLENKASWRSDREKPWSRESTRVVVDDPKNLHRYTLGDINTEYRNYQQGIHLAGFKVEKMASLNPYRKKTKKPQYFFMIERPSEVKIYINGFLKDKKKLDAGEYSLSELRLDFGVNKIRLEITDKEGKTTKKFFSLLKDRSLLKAGTSSYALEVGVPAYTRNSEHQYDNSAVLVSGHYKAGLSDTLTADASFITDGKNIQAGVNALMPTPVGGISGRVSTLRTSSDKMGYAVGAEYQYSASDHKKDAVQFSVSGDYFDKEFNALNYSLEQKQLRSATNEGTESRIYASVGKKITDDISVNLNLQRETSYSKDEVSYSANIGLNHSLKHGGSVSAQFNYENNKQKDKSVSLRLNLPLTSDNKEDRHKNLSMAYNTLDERLVSSFFISPKGNVGKDSIGVSFSHYGSKESQTVSGNISYRGDIAEIGLSQTITKSQYAGEKYQAYTNARLKTAVSFADTQIGISKPIRDSFALVTGPDNQNKDIAVMRGKGGFSHSAGKDLPDYYQSVIQEEGMPAVVGISSYHYNTINVDSTALPLGSDIERTEFELKSSYKRGYVLKAGGEAGVIVDATLVDSDDKPLSLKGGELEAMDKKGKTISFFTNRTGRIRLMSVPPGRYRLVLYDYKDSPEQVLNIPNKIGKRHVVGKVQIKT